MEGEKPGRGRFDGPILGEEERAHDRQVLHKQRGEKGSDLVGGRSLAWHRLEKYVEAPERGMVLLRQRDGVAWPVNIITFDKVGNPLVKHVKNVKCGRF
jgi:hypothetical protein